MCVCESVSATLIVAYIKVSVLLIHILCSRLSVAVAGLGWACVHVLVNLKRTTAAQIEVALILLLPLLVSGVGIIRIAARRRLIWGQPPEKRRQLPEGWAVALLQRPALEHKLVNVVRTALRLWQTVPCR